MSTAQPSSTTARGLTASSLPPASRRAVQVMLVGLGLTLVALAAPVVDLLAVGDLTAHLQTVYAGTGVAAPPASVVTATLVVLGLLGALSWVASIRAVRGQHRGARVTAGVFLVLGALLAVADLSITEYGRPILPMWVGVLAILPCLPGLVAVVLVWRRPAAAPATSAVRARS